MREPIARGVQVFEAEATEPVIYSEADKWTIEGGFLHVFRAGNGGRAMSIASYPPGQWQRVLLNYV